MPDTVVDDIPEQFMAAMKKRNLSAISILLLVFSAIVFVYDILYIFEASRVNDALRRGNYVHAASSASNHGLFAKGYDHQRRGELEQAFKTYTKLERLNDPGLENALTYNMANLYLQQALNARRDNDMDLAIPLIELAKQNYRDLLRINSDDWSAKYNLERALQLLPDLEEQAIPEEVMPERSLKAAGSVQVYDQLP
jgi:mxaK protein